MSNTGSRGVERFLEWIAALVGAANCLFVPLAFARSQENLFPLPGLYFIELALVGVFVLGFVALRTKLSARWPALPWLAAGIILAFVVLGGFSIGFYLIPALVAFVVVGWLMGGQAGRARARNVALMVVAAVVQGSVIALLILFT